MFSESSAPVNIARPPCGHHFSHPPWSKRFLSLNLSVTKLYRVGINWSVHFPSGFDFGDRFWVFRSCHDRPTCRPSPLQSPATKQRLFALNMSVTKLYRVGFNSLVHFPSWFSFGDVFWVFRSCLDRPTLVRPPLQLPATKLRLLILILQPKESVASRFQSICAFSMRIQFWGCFLNVPLLRWSPDTRATTTFNYLLRSRCFSLYFAAGRTGIASALLGSDVFWAVLVSGILFEGSAAARMIRPHLNASLK